MIKALQRSLLVVFAIVLICFSASISIAANVTWEGDFDSNWNEPDNWSIGRVPLEVDDVFFTSGSNPCLMSVDTSYTVKSMTIDGYTGIVTQDANLSVTNKFYQNSGNFVSNRTKTFSSSDFHLTKDSKFYRFSGSGSSVDPYLIYDVYGLQAVTGFSTLSFRLANDINASVTSNWTHYFTAIGYDDEFSGSFDGDGYSVKNLKLDQNWENCAMFYYIYGARITNLGLENVSTGYSRGILVYRAWGHSKIENCFVSGSGYGSVGFIEDIGDSSILKNCYSSYVRLGSPQDSYGGLARDFEYGSQVIDCFHTGVDNTIGTKLSSTESKSKSSYNNWDFASKWLIDQGKSTPVLYNNVYSWTGGGVSGFWQDPVNWNRKLGYPSSISHRVLINTGESVNINTPSTSETIRLGGLQIGPSYTKRLLLRGPFEIDNSGTREGSIILLNGTLECQSGSNILLRLDGNFIKAASARFTAGGGTVSLESSSSSSISGSFDFYNLKCSAPGKTLSFDAGSVQTVEGSLSINGTPSNPVVLKGSIRGGTRWIIDPKSTTSVSNAIIMDSHNISGTDISASTCYDGGNNIGWDFGGYTITATSNAGGVMSSSGEVKASKYSTTEIVVTPSSGYYIGNVWIDGLSTTESLSGSSKTFVFSYITSHHSMEVLFVRDGVKIWDGGGDDNNWSTPNNWSGNSSPGVSDAVIFNSSSTKNVFIDFNTNVGSISIEAGYTGTMIQSMDVTVQGSFEQYGGTFISDPLHDLTIGKNFRIPDSYGSFTRFTGDGDDLSPYLIYDVYGLQAVRINWDKNFELANDIDASTTSNWKRSSSSEGFNPIGFSTVETDYQAGATYPFTGSFNGRNYVINGLKIARNRLFIGVFGAVYGAEISDVGVEDIEISIRRNDLDGTTYDVGGLIGQANNSIISGCFVSGNITKSTSESSNVRYIGGLIGESSYSSFYNSYANVDILSFANWSDCCGGFGGSLYSGVIDSCYSKGNILSSVSSGGFAYSISNAYVHNCYATGNVVCSGGHVGGFVVYGNLISNCYAAGSVSGTEYIGGFGVSCANLSNVFFTDQNYDNGIGSLESVSDMKKKQTFTGWDFWSKWTIDEGQSFPYLLMEEYNWTPRIEGNDWGIAGNWTKNLKRVAAAPSTKYDKVYINSEESFSTPATMLEIGGLHLGPDCNVLTLGSDLFINRSGTTVEGSLIIAGGTLECSDKTIYLSGHLLLSAEADLKSDTSDFVITGEGFSIVSGSPSFYNLTIAEPDKNVSFEAGSYITVESVFSSSGEASRQVLLRSTSLGSRWNLVPTNASAAKVYFSVVSDSNNLSSESITTVRSFNGGNNNALWIFDGHAVSAIAGIGGYISAEGVDPFENARREIGVASGETIKLTVSSKEGYYIGFVKINGLSTNEVLTDISKDFYIKVDSYNSFEAYFAPIGIRIWDGGGDSNNWSDACNWTGNITPETSDTIVFNSTSSKSSLIDSFNPGNTVYSVSIEAVSSINIGQNADLLITASFEQSGGTFISNTSYNFSVGETSNFYVSNSATFERFDGGDGTTSNPYTIVDVYGLQAVNCKLDKSFKLGNDIDATSTRYWNWNGATCEGFKPLGYSNINLVPPTDPFSGGFDGDHKAITGLYIYTPSRKFAGLFGGVIDSDPIRNIGLENIYVSGESYVGGLIGYANYQHKYGNIFGNYVRGNINGSSYVGGLIGQADDLIYDCYSDSTVTGWSYIGGLVGATDSLPVIRDCYSSGEVYGHSYVGGFAGSVWNNSGPILSNCYSLSNVIYFGTPYYVSGFANEGGTITNCFAAGFVTGEVPAGIYDDIAGFEESGDYISGCYYVDGRYNNENTGAYLVSIADLKRESTFSGWDFAATWTIDENSSYPQLMWENYTWTGSADGTSWSTAGNWLRNLKIPSGAPVGTIPAEKIYIGTGEAINTPGSALAIGALQLGPSFEGTIHLGADIELDSSYGRSGSLRIYGGTLDATENSRNIHLDSDFIKSSSAIFTPGNSTFYVADSSRPTKIIGSPRFYNLRCDDDGKKISFEAGSVVTVEGLFRTEGLSGSPVFLQSLSPGSRWRINLLGPRDYINYAAVQDSHNISNEVINRPNCADYNNNVNWLFGSYLVRVIYNSGGAVTHGGDNIVATGETITISITPEAGYHVGFVKKDAIPTTEGFSLPNVATFESVSSYHSLEVYFAKDGEKVWFGGDPATENWSAAMNWTGYSVPTSDSRVVFNDVSSKNSVIDMSFLGTIGDITIEAAYSGVVTQNKNLSVSGNYHQYGGAFLCSAPQTYALSVGRDFAIPTTEGSFLRYSGDGTSESTAYGIYDVFGLQAANSNVTKNFKLMRPIDASATRHWNWNGVTYEGFRSIGDIFEFSGTPRYFAGRFDGQGKVISNLYSYRANTISNGLFGLAAGNTITNLGLSNVHISGKGFIGGLVGFAQMCNISGCYVTGYVSSEPFLAPDEYGFELSISGGLMGVVIGSNISDCYSSCEVRQNGEAGAFIPSLAGGLLGICISADISNCYSTSFLVSDNPISGGLIGVIQEGSISNSYFTDSSYDNTFGELKTFDELKRKSTFVDWDFDDIWSMDEGINIPYFLWEIWNWDGGAGTGTWTNSENWTRKSGYPSLPTDKVYINYGAPSLTILTPAGLPLTVGALKLGSSFEGTLSLRNDLLLTPEARSGELAVLNGFLDTGAYSVRLSGDFVVKAPGQFVRGENIGSVTFADTRLISSIYGNNSFYNFTCVTPGKNLSFEAGFVQTVEGTFRLSGEAGNNIVLRSLSDGEKWYVYPTGTRETPYFVDVKDSDNLSSEALNPYYSLNTGNTTNWFGDHYITTYTNKVGPTLEYPGVWGTMEPFGTVPVEHWQNGTFVITPSNGYRIVNVMTDGVSLGAVSIHTFEEVSSDHTIEAIFTINPFIITAEATGMGSGSILPSGEVEVDYGARQVFTVEADDGNYIAYIRIDGVVTNEGGNPNIYVSPYYITFESMLLPHTIEAHFLDLNDRFWTRYGGSPNWSEPGNWTGNTTPPVGTRVFFSSISTEDAVIDPSYHGSVESIYMLNGYTGVISAETTFTVEATFSMESGSFVQKTYDMYVGGDFYNTSENYTGKFFMSEDSIPAGSFTSEGGTLFFNGTSTQTIMSGSIPNEGLFKTMPMDVIHSGSGMAIVTDEAFVIMGGFTNEAGTFEVTQMAMPGDFINNSDMIVNNQVFWVMGDFVNTGTFRARDTVMELAGNFTNSGYLSSEVRFEENEGEYIPVSGWVIFNGDGLQIIDTGGTGEGHLLPIVADVNPLGGDLSLNDGIRRLVSPLRTHVVFNILTFEANGQDIFTSVLLNAAYNGGSYEGVYIESAPSYFSPFMGDEDKCELSGNITLHGLSCRVPGKKLYFNEGVVTVESGGYITIEGSSVPTTPEMTALLKHSGNTYDQWIIDAKTLNRDINYVYVQDSLNVDSTSIETRYCVDGGNNTNWILGRYIAVSSNSGGTIEPPGITYYEYLDSATFEISADDGYYIGYIFVDGVSAEAGGGYPSSYCVTFESMTSDHSIEAYFDREGVRTWTGLGTNEYWSNPYNWSNGRVPMSTEEALFVGSRNRSSIIDSAFGGTIKGISVASGYTSSITQSRNLYITGTFEQIGGTFVSPVNYAFTVEGSFYISSTPESFSRFGGSGVEGDPYIIYDIYGLQAMMCYRSNYFELSGDIDASSTARWNWNGSTYEGFVPVGNYSQTFTGNFDGNEKTISGLYISRESDYIGLFGHAESAVIADIRLSNISVKGGTRVGGLAGRLTTSEVSGCYVTGNINGDGDYVGGLAGVNYYSSQQITNCYSTANVTGRHYIGGLIGANNSPVDSCYATGSVSGTGNAVGGLAGISSSTITNCYAMGNTDGDQKVGGLLGYNISSSVTYCYATGVVSGNTDLGGLVGTNGGTVSMCHFTDDAHDNGIGSLETSSQIKQKTRFAGWDFDRTWTIDELKSSPQLMWQDGIYTWTGSADGITWTNPNNWNKKSGYPSTKEHKAFVNSGSSTITINPTSLGGLQIGPEFSGIVKPEYDITFDGTGTREGSLVILGGKFDVNDKNINIYGNFKKASEATFEADEARSVIFTGEAPSLMQGSTTFTRLTCTVPGKALTFEAGTLQTITERFRIIGTSGNRITLRSSSEGMSWMIDPASAEVMNVNVKDSSNEADFYINPGGSNIDAGNNYKWFQSLTLHTITATSSANGIISPEGSVQVQEGGSKTFYFYPSSGYYLSYLAVNGISTSTALSYTFTNVTSDNTIYASFSAISDIRYITAEVAANQGGTIEPIGIISLQSGTGKIFRMYPNGGWYINDILVDGGSVSPLNSVYEFTNVTTNRTIAVQYALNDGSVYLITAETSGSGTGTILPSSAAGPIGVKPGQNMTFFMEPDVGNHMSGLYVDGNPQTLQSQYEFASVGSNHIITASFEPDTFTITATCGAYGTITPEGSVSVNYGEDKTFLITPVAGYRVNELFVDGSSTTATTEYEFINVTSDRSIYATFTVEPIAITATAGTGGRISPSGEVNVIYGADQTFNTQPDPGYQLSGILVDGSSFTTESSYTFYTVTQSHTIEATFEAYGETTLYITADATGSGTIEPIGIVGVGPGGSQQFIMIPDSGYHISSLTIDGTSSTIESIYTFSSVATHHTISVVFASNAGADVRLITAETTGQGTIRPNGTIGVKPGASQSFFMAPAEGNVLLDLMVDGAHITPVSLYTFSSVVTNHSIEAVFSSLYTPGAPTGLRVGISGTDISLAWNQVDYATRYIIYKSADKFAAITGWASADTTSSLTWTDTNATISTTEAYYIVRAINAGGEGPNSSMGVYKKLVLTYNVGDTNDNVIGLPYTTSLQKASDIVTSIEGGTGPGTNQYISSVGIWNSSGQNYYTAYQYIDGIGWLGDGDAVLNPGTGILLLLSGNSSSASVEVSGVDRDVELNFTYNVGDTNDNVIGLPYTTSLQKASDIVTSIEGGTGPGTNQYISSVGIWNSSGQNYYTAYQYIDGIGWLGDGDAVLNPGTGILLLLTGDKTWTPGLVIPARE